MANRKLSDADMKRSAEYILDEAQRRRGRRQSKGLEKQWKEIDRQLKMEPVAKLTAEGRPIEGTEWFPQLELPLQAQTHEMLNADARRLMFPDDRNFFSMRALMDDENLEKLERKSIIAGLDQNGDSVVSALGLNKLDQDSLDEINSAALRHFHRQYDMRGQWDLINGEAFKYGVGIARARRVNVPVTFSVETGIRRKTTRIPVIIPRPIKNVFLDDSRHAVLNQGIMVEPSVIEWAWHRLIDLKKAAKAGSSDFNDEAGGWMKARIEKIESHLRADDHIDLLEFEGDLVIPQSQGKNIDLPNVMATVLVGRGGPEIVRLRSREFHWRSYLFSYYHRDQIESAYGTSPLMIGSPIHKAATEALSRMLQAAALNTQPPIQWDPSDYWLESTGGPEIVPGAKWKAISDIKAHEIGKPAAMLQIYLAILQQYADATGSTAPRLGSQTKSHQTAFAVDSEIGRGMVRTVDYVRSTQFGPMASWLKAEFEMGRKSLDDELVYLDKFRMFIKLSGEDLAPHGVFDVHGAAGPLQERELQQRRLQALNTVVGIEIQKIQLAQAGGEQPETLNLTDLQKMVLRDGGFTDVDDLFASGTEGVPGATQGGPELPGGAGNVVDIAGGNAPAGV